MQAIVDIQRRFGTGLSGGESFSAIQSAYTAPFIDPLYREFNLFPSDYTFDVLGPYPPMGDLPGDPPAIPVPKETEPKIGQAADMPKLPAMTFLIVIGLALCVAKYS